MTSASIDQLVEQAKKGVNLGVPQLLIPSIRAIRRHPDFQLRRPELEPVVKSMEAEGYARGLPILLGTAEQYAKAGDTLSRDKLLETAKYCAGVIGKDISDDIAKI